MLDCEGNVEKLGIATFKKFLVFSAFHIQRSISFMYLSKVFENLFFSILIAAVVLMKANMEKVTFSTSAEV